MSAKKPQRVVLKFTEDFGTYKKGDTQEYHISTAQPLIDKGLASVVEKKEKYVPKAAK